MLDLERQVVGAALRGCLRCRRERRGSCIGLGLCRWERRCTCISYRGHLTTNHVVGTDFIEPTALILMGIDVELDGKILTILYVELLDTVFSEKAEYALARILSGNLDDILL